MSSRRPKPPRGSSRPQRPPRTTKRARTNAPRLHSGATRRALVIGGDGAKPRALSMRFLAIIISVIFAVIIVTPALRTYLAQQEETRELKASVEEARARNEDLSNQLALWNDPEYVAAQARQRLGYVAPGQVLYIVTDPDEGTPEERRAALEEELNYNRRAATPWFTTLWDSVTIAGYVAGAPSEAINPADETEKNRPGPEEGGEDGDEGETGDPGQAPPAKEEQ